MAVELLSDVACRNASSQDKEIRKLSDGGGLYLWVYKDGRKYWRLRYWISGKEKSLSLGVYPKVTLKEASYWNASSNKMINFFNILKAIATKEVYHDGEHGTMKVK